MTSKAREVLSDCKLALELLEQSKTDQMWRVHWFAAIALVRTVGDVLDKVDGANPLYAKAVKEAYRRWKADRETHQIFWQFIKDQRDKLIHEYQSDVHPLDKSSILAQFKAVPIGGGESIDLAEVFELDENIYRPMLEGPWVGDDGRDVLQEAIDWWTQQLQEIDEAAFGRT